MTRMSSMVCGLKYFKKLGAVYHHGHTPTEARSIFGEQAHVQQL